MSNCEENLWNDYEVKFNIIKQSHPDLSVELPDRNRETLEQVQSRYQALIEKEERLANEEERKKDMKICLTLLSIFF